MQAFNECLSDYRFNEIMTKHTSRDEKAMDELSEVLTKKFSHLVYETLIGLVSEDDPHRDIMKMSFRNFSQQTHVKVSHTKHGHQFRLRVNYPETNHANGEYEALHQRVAEAFKPKVLIESEYDQDHERSIFVSKNLHGIAEAVRSILPEDDRKSLDKFLQKPGHRL